MRECCKSCVNVLEWTPRYICMHLCTHTLTYIAADMYRKRAKYRVYIHRENKFVGMHVRMDMNACLYMRARICSYSGTLTRCCTCVNTFLNSIYAHMRVYGCESVLCYAWDEDAYLSKMRVYACLLACVLCTLRSPVPSIGTHVQRPGRSYPH
jgi:hypothetical protein